MKRLKFRAAAVLLISMMCFSVLLSANMFKVAPVKGYVTWGIQSPTGIAVDGSGNVYAIDCSNSHVEKFSSGGAYLGQVDSGQLSSPFGIAVDVLGNVYVADTNNNRVVKFLTDSTVQTWGSLGSGNGQFYGPAGIAVDASGNVYVADMSNQRVEKFSSGGVYLGQFGSQGTDEGQFNGPYGIAVDGSGNIYVTDKGNDRVQKFLDDGTGTFPFKCQFGSYGTGDGQFKQPLGIAVDSSGYVYVADSLNDRIQKFYSPPPGLNYVFHAKWGSFGTGNYQFWTTHEVCVDSSMSVYVADFGNNRIQKFSQYVLAIGKLPAGLGYNYVLPYEGWDYIVEGTVVSITAVATHGYVFTGWSGDLSGLANPATITVDRDKTVTADFGILPSEISMIWDTGYEDYPFRLVQTSDGGFALAGLTITLPGYFGMDGYLIKTGPAGEIEWTRTYDQGGEEWFESVAQTSDGGFILAGCAADGDRRAWLVKTFADGTSDWQMVYGYGTACDVVETGDGYIVVGYSYGIDQDAWLAKVDYDGNLSWSRTVGGTGPDVFRDIVTTSDGGFAIVGGFNQSSIATARAWLFKTDANCNEQWNQTYYHVNPDDGAEAICLVETDDGGFVLGGDSYNTATADFDALLVKTDVNGNAQWTNIYQYGTGAGPVEEAASAVVQAPDGGFVFAGSTDCIGAGDAWLVKTDANGIVQWNQTYGGPARDQAFDLILTNDYGYALTGLTNQTDIYSSANANTFFIKTVPEPGLYVYCAVDDPSPVTEDWSYLLTYPDAHTQSFALPAGGGTASFAGEPFAIGGNFTITATPKYGYGTDVTVQTSPNSGYSINENGREATVILDPNGIAWVTFLNVKEALGSTPAGDPPPVGMAAVPPLKVVPVQAAWNPNKNGLPGEVDLVAGKPTAIVVNATGVPIGAKLVLTFEDASSPPQTSPALPSSMEVIVGDTTVNSLVLFPPVGYPVISLDTQGTSRNVTIKVTSNSGQLIEPTTVTVRKTNNLSLYYCYLLKSGGQGYPAPTAQGYSDTVGNSTIFMNQTYPVKTVDYTKGGLVSGTGTMLKDCMAIADLALKSGRAIGVAVVSGWRTKSTDPMGYFEARGAPAGAVGVSYGPNFKGVVVAEGYWTAPAHEVGHVYNLYWEHPEEYLQKPDYGLSASGINPSTSTSVQSNWRTGQDFMGVAPYQTLAKTWVTNQGTALDPDGTYNDLFKKFTQTLNDPEIVIVSGIFHKDGTFEMPLAWSRLEQGTESQIVPGDYSLKFIGAAGTPQVNFDAQYYASYSMGVTVGKDAPSDSMRAGLGQVPIDEAGFIFATELPAGTTEVQVTSPAAETPTNPEGVVATVPASQIVKANAPIAYITDADYNPVSSFECVFTSDKATGKYKLSATNPGTFCYNLEVTNMDPTQAFTAEVTIPMDFTLRPPYPGASAVQVDEQPVAYTFDPAAGVLTVPNILVEEGHPRTLSVKLKYAPTRTFDSTAPTRFHQGYLFAARVNAAGQPPVEQAPATVTAVGKKVTAIAGFLTDTAGFPKYGLIVKVNGGQLQTTGADGFYFFEPTAAGTYTVEVINNEIPPRQLATASVKVSKDQFVEKDFTLNPADPAITGYVADAFGDGVAGVSVQLLDRQGKIFAATMTNNNGKYVFRFSQPGQYTINITVPTGYNAAVTSTTLNVRQFQTVRVDFTLTPNS